MPPNPGACPVRSCASALLGAGASVVDVVAGRRALAESGGSRLRPTRSCTEKGAERLVERVRRALDLPAGHRNRVDAATTGTHPRGDPCERGRRETLDHGRGPQEGPTHDRASPYQLSPTDTQLPPHPIIMISHLDPLSSHRYCRLGARPDHPAAAVSFLPPRWGRFLVELPGRSANHLGYRRRCVSPRPERQSRRIIRVAHQRGGFGTSRNMPPNPGACPGRCCCLACC
jgi:hypothetical protein